MKLYASATVRKLTKEGSFVEVSVVLINGVHVRDVANGAATAQELRQQNPDLRIVAHLRIPAQRLDL